MDSPFINYEALDTAIISEAESPMVGKWLVLFEALDEDGSRRVGWMSSSETSTVDELGLVRYFDHARGATVQRECS